MPIGGSLSVTNTNNPNVDKFDVKFNRNTKITNYMPNDTAEVGQFTAEVKNGKKGYATAVFSNDDLSKVKDKPEHKLKSLDLRSTRYNIFDALRKLDNNASDVSAKDLEKAGALVNKDLGVVKVNQDKEAGVTTIFCEDGAVLRFDVETSHEEAVRKSNEAQQQEKADSNVKKEAQQQENFDAELHENTKSDFQKFLEGITKLFK